MVEELEELEDKPPPAVEVEAPGSGSDGVPVLQRLRALSYGSRRQFNSEEEENKLKSELEAKIASKREVKEEKEEEKEQKEQKEEKEEKEEETPVRAETKESVVEVEVNEEKEGEEEEVIEGDFEEKYYQLQDKYLKIQKTVFELQEQREEHAEKQFKELEKLQFEHKSQQVELEQMTKRNESLEHELRTAQESIKQKSRTIGQLRDSLIDSGSLAIQKHAYLTYDAGKKDEEKSKPSSKEAEVDAPELERVRKELAEARSEISTIKKKRLQLELKVKNAETEMKHKDLDIAAKAKRQDELLSEVHNLRMSSVQDKKEVDVLEKEIELMLSEKWNSKHYSTKKETDFDAPSESVRYKRFMETIKVCKEESKLLRGQLKAKENEMKALSASLSDSRRMAKVTEDVLKKKVAQLRSGSDEAKAEVSKIESSLRRSVEGLVKALEEQEDKTQQLEKELKSMSCLLEGIDTLDTVMKGINGGQGAEQGGAKSPPAASKGDAKRGLMALPSSASSAGTTSSAKKKENIKKSRRKTIIPVLAQLPGASSSSKPSAERPTSDQTFDIFLAIQQIPFLKAMDSALQKKLAEQAKVTQCFAGDLLIAQGETGSKAYILLEGLLEVFATIEGKEEFLKVVKPGAIIGEIALLKSEPRNTNVRSVTDSRLFVLEKESLDAILAAHPEYRGGLEELASQRQKENQDMLNEKYALSTFVRKEDIKTAILEDIITENDSGLDTRDEEEENDGKSDLSIDKRMAVLKSCESTLNVLHSTKKELLNRLSEYDEMSAKHNEESTMQEQALQEDLKNVNAEIRDIKNELFATCQELDDRESELCSKDEELEALKQQVEGFRVKEEENEKKIKKEKDDRLELKKKYDEAAKAERDIIERTEKLWSSINSQQKIDQLSYENSYQKRRDNDILKKLKSTKKELDSFQSNLVFLDGKMIPPAQEFNIVVTPKASTERKKMFREYEESNKHVSNMKLIDDLIDQIK